MGDPLYRNIIHRTELVVGPDSMRDIGAARVLVVGVGGVGSWCAEALVRSGVTDITIVDSDIVCATNINRQAQATSVSVGRIKVEEMKRRLLEINPGLSITAINKPFTEETHHEFHVERYDYIVDAIDSIKHKAFLIELCMRLGKKFVSSMGAGARTNPLKIKVTKLEKTVNCTLASTVRRRLRQKKVRIDFLCVYSDEVPVKPAAIAMCASGKCVCNCNRDDAAADGVSIVDWCAQKKQINGAMVHITGIFGFTIAGLIIEDIIGKKPIPIRRQK